MRLVVQRRQVAVVIEFQSSSAPEGGCDPLHDEPERI